MRNDLLSREDIFSDRAHRISVAECKCAAQRVRELDTQAFVRGLHAQRERLHISQRQAAHRIGVTHGAYRAWETGHHWPSAYYLPLIADGLGCTMSDLFLEEAPADE